MTIKKNYLPLIVVVLTISFIFTQKIKQISCKAADNQCPAELQNQVEKLSHRSFFFTDFKKELLSQQNSESQYILKDVKKIFPNKLNLEFEPTKNAYLIKINSQNYLINQSGSVITNQTSNEEILAVIWENEGQIIDNNTNKVNSQYHQILTSISQNLSDQGINKTELIWIDTNNITLKIPDYPVFLFDEQTIETRIKKVATIVNAKEIKDLSLPIKEIDMRYELPVLRTIE